LLSTSSVGRFSLPRHHISPKPLHTSPGCLSTASPQQGPALTLSTATAAITSGNKLLLRQVPDVCPMAGRASDRWARQQYNARWETIIFVGQRAVLLNVRCGLLLGVVSLTIIGLGGRERNVHSLLMMKLIGMETMIEIADAQ